MKDLLFIVNPAAGKTHIKNKLFDVIDAFSLADYRVTVCPTRKPFDGRNIVMDEGANYDMIVCAGGDGTLDDVVTGLMMSDFDVPLGYIPAGSTNDFARSLGIPRTPIPAVQNIISGIPFPIDIGSLNDDYFVYIAAFGAFTEVSYSTNQHFKNVFGHAAYILNGVKNIPSITSYNVKIKYDNQEISGDYIYAMITNSLSVGGFKNLVPEDVEFDDGEFECVLIHTPKNAIELQAIVNSLLINEINDNYMTYFKASRVKVYSDKEIPWTVDGEYGGSHTKVVIQNHQRALSIMR